jgi:hypothetical protein
VDVQASAALVHVHVSAHRTLDLDGLRAVTLLGVELASIHRLDVHHVTLGVNTTGVAVGCRDDCAASRVEAEVRLVHQLFVEAGVDGSVVVGGDGVVLIVLWVDLSAVLEEFVEDRLLLVVVNVHAFSLDCTAMRSKDQTVISLHFHKESQAQI